LDEAATPTTNIILPANSPAALALREPNLLVPDRQPNENIALDRRWLSQSSLWTQKLVRQDPDSIVTGGVSVVDSGLGPNGYGLAFNGINDSLYLRNGVEGYYLNKTVFMSFDTNTPATTQYALMAFDNDDDRFYVGADGGNVYVRIGSSSALSSTPPLTTNGLVNVAIIVRSGNAIVYINGERFSYSYSGTPGDTNYTTLGAYDREGTVTVQLSGYIYFYGVHDGLAPEPIARTWTQNRFQFFNPVNNTPVLIGYEAAAGLPAYIGSNQITSVYYGSTEITEIYRGSTKLWP
jgi:hypothetical protein